MKKQKVRLVIVLAAFLVPLLSVTPVMAWGPERPTYTMEHPADHAVFNSITNNAAIGDERDFVRIVEADSSNTLTSELIIDAGKEYVVSIYFHNDASETYNTAEHNRVGMALGTRVISYFPKSLAKHERGKVEGILTANNTDPKTVWDEAYITAQQAITLEYVKDSAKVYSDWPMNGANLSETMFTADGALIGLTSMNGAIPGCDRFAGRVVYRLRTVATEQPEPEPEPEPEPTPDEPTPEPTPDEPKPETPQELPETGPAEVALAAVIVIAVVAGFVYWRKTSHAVKKVTRSAKGRGGKRK